ncbi:MAG TPA: Swt1 family HEPN domain-containing protein, partial [Nitrospiria bacterium]|nr:Swt1 family HEPN domain-containing protein [Nitrospiria bacterium]
MEINLNNLLQKAATSLAAYLEKVLPPHFEDWWKQAVLNSLSLQQRRRVEQRGLGSLAALDLAALLRVLDQNWYQIATKLDLTSEARHFVKEMQTIRNRWAHATTEGFPLEDVYRDLDTLQRFAAVIGADDTFVQEVRSSKTALLARETGTSNKSEANTPTPSQAPKNHDAEFEPGQIVCVKSNPTIQGAV